MPRKPSHHNSDVYAYLAGFVDGEGCIVAYCDARVVGPSYPHVTLSAYNTVKQPIELLARFYGGKIRLRQRKNPKHKPCWEWICRDVKEVHWALTRMLPWLTAKRPKAIAALTILSLAPGTGQKLNPKFAKRVERAFAVFGSKVHLDNPNRYELTCEVCGATYSRSKKKGTTCNRKCTSLLREQKKRELKEKHARAATAK